MRVIEKVKYWYSRNKKRVWRIGTVVLVCVGAGVAYVLYKNKKMPFEDWIKIASIEELNEVYNEKCLEFNKTGKKPVWMEQISHEIGMRWAEEWKEKHPPNPDPYYRWTDANRWDRD